MGLKLENLLPLPAGLNVLFIELIVLTLDARTNGWWKCFGLRRSIIAGCAFAGARRRGGPEAARDEVQFCQNDQDHDQGDQEHDS